MTSSGTRIQQLLKEVEQLKKSVKQAQDKHDELLGELKKALDYLRKAKVKFAPETTNSIVDEFLEKHKDL